jgi:hypothetical protein
MLFRPRLLDELRQDQAKLRRDLSIMAGDYRKLPPA